jgi:hypothetical protein
MMRSLIPSGRPERNGAATSQAIQPKPVELIAEFLSSPEPPLHLLLGPDAFDYVLKELNLLHDEFAAWEHVTRSTNFDGNA